MTPTATGALRYETKADLAKAARLGLNTIRWYEAYHGIRFPLVQARWGSLAIIADAFKRNGLTLTPGSPGVSVDKYYKRSSKDGWDPPPIYARHAHWKKREVHSKEARKPMQAARAS